MKYFAFTVLLLFVCVTALSLTAIFKNKRFGINAERNNEPFGRDAMTQMKALAIIAVVISHLGNGFGIRYLTPLGSLGVAVFLFCSGFGLECSVSKNGIRGFWRKRLLTAYMPYLLFELCSYPFLAGISFKEIILDVFLIDTIHPYGWYMQCLFLYYIVFYVGSLLELKIKNSRIFTVAISALLQFIFLDGLFKQQIFSFTAGILFAKLPKISKLGGWKASLLSSFCSLAIGASALAVKQFDFIRNANWVIYNFVYAIQAFFLGLAIIFAVNAIIKWEPRCVYGALIWIGLVSYDIYLFHGYIIPKAVSFASLTVFTLILSATTPIIHCIFKLLQKIIERSLIPAKAKEEK